MSNTDVLDLIHGVTDGNVHQAEHVPDHVADTDATDVQTLRIGENEQDLRTDHAVRHLFVGITERTDPVRDLNTLNKNHVVQFPKRNSARPNTV